MFDEGAAEAGLIRVRGNVENYAVAEGEEGEGYARVAVSKYDSAETVVRSIPGTPCALAGRVDQHGE